MGCDFTVSHAIELLLELPKEARILKAIGSSNAYSVQEDLLCLIEYWCHVIAWQNTKDGQRGSNKPKPVFESLDNSKKRENDLEIKPTSREELALLFGRREDGN